VRNKHSHNSEQQLTTPGTCGICLSSWTIGSSLIGIGLTASQAMTSVTIGMLIASVTAYLNGTPGAKHHLGYGMLARSAFGLWGSYFCIMLNVFQSFVFYVSCVE
jgi:NCS1 family nucleobase:cation symporter-1